MQLSPLLRVMAQVSCELVAPKENRPNEGIMFFNIELSPMASPAFEQGRWGQPEEAVVLLTDLTHRVLFSPCLLWRFSSYRKVIICSQTVGDVREAEQAAGEMPEKLQVHWYGVALCGVRGKGDKHTPARQTDGSFSSTVTIICVCSCVRSGVADQSGCPHAKQWREPDGCRQHCRHHRSVPLQTPWRRHPGRGSHSGESAPTPVDVCLHQLPLTRRVGCNFVFISSVQSRGERPNSSEYLPHAHQCQLRLLPTRVIMCIRMKALLCRPASRWTPSEF